MIMKEKNVGILGLLSVLILITAISIFGFLNAEFSFINDFINKLGAKGEPYAFWFNLFGFITVGYSLFLTNNLIPFKNGTAKQFNPAFEREN